MSKINFPERGECADCGSRNVTLVRMDWDYNIIAWFTCNECECLFLEAFDYASNGVPSEEDIWEL